MPSRWREVAPIACVALVATLVAFHGAGDGTLAKWDEALYGAAPRYMQHFGSLLLPVDAEGKFWGWFGKPPLIPWLVMLSTAIFGHTTFAVRAPFCAFTAASAVLVYLLVRRAGGRSAGLVAAALFIFSPQWLAIGGTASIEIPLIFFFLLTFLLYLWAFDRGPWAPVVAGVAFGLAIMSKQIMAALAVPVLVAVEVSELRAGGWRPAIRRLALVGGTALLVSGWWFVVAFAEAGRELWSQFFGFHVVWRLGQAVPDAAGPPILGAGPSTASMVIAAAGILAGWRRADADRRSLVAFGAYFAVSWLMFGNLSRHNHPWYYLHDATAMALGTAMLLDRHLREERDLLGLLAVGAILLDTTGRLLGAFKIVTTIPVAVDVAVGWLALRTLLGVFKLPVARLDVGVLVLALALTVVPTLKRQPRSDLELVAAEVGRAGAVNVRVRKPLDVDWSVFATYLGAQVEFTDGRKEPPRRPGRTAVVDLKPTGFAGERRIGKFYVAFVD